MAKLTLTDISNISGAETAAITTLNNNAGLIEIAFENTLSRNGTSPNQMGADIDLNTYSVLNAGSIETDSLTLNGTLINTVDDISTKGDKGWSPVLVNVPDNPRIVQQLIDWTGGEGAVPTDFINYYVTQTGYSLSIADGTDIRGPSGSGIGDLLAANNGSDFASVSTTFSTLKQPATTSATGVLEIATLAEALAGTPTNLAIVSDVMKSILDIVCPVGNIGTFYQSTAPTGWLSLDGTTIGDGTSGGTGRANADTETLFTLIWNQTTNADAAIQTNTGVPSSRGATAAVDFAAHKRIPLADLRDYFIRGKSASRGIANIQADAYEAHTHTGTTSSGGSHNHTVTADGEAYGSNGVLNTGNFMICGGDVNSTAVKPVQTSSTGGSHTHTFTTASSGSTETRPQNIAFLYCMRY